MTSQSPPLARSSNDVLEATSFLSGTNAAFVESLYAQYLENPDAVDPSWRAYFAGLGQTALDPAQLWPRAGMAPGQETTIGEWRSRRRPDRPMARAQGRDQRGPISTRRRRIPSAPSSSCAPIASSAHLEADLDPLNITPRQPHPQLEPTFYGFHAEDLDRPIFLDGVMGLSTSTPRQVTDILKRTYCGRIGYEFMHINDAEQKAAPHRGPGQGDRVLARRQEGDPQQAGRGRRLREIRVAALPRHQALRPGRRRGDDPGAGADHQARRPARRARDRARHGASRAPQRARQRHEQALSPAVPRILRRQRQSGRGPGLRRREIPSRRLVRPPVRQPQRPSFADRQPVASGGVRSGRARQGARQAAAARGHHGAHQRAAAAPARRRGLRRPGRGRGMLLHERDAGLQHRRHDPFHHQQPDRLHHLAGLLALLALLHRHCADGAGADLPCERRRSGGRGALRAHRHRIPPALPQGRGDRHGCATAVSATTKRWSRPSASP